MLSRPVASINNSGWKKARSDVAMPQVRVHDLKHTFGRRLRAAGVSFETRKVLLGHKNGEITTHYSAPELAELIGAVSRIRPEKSGTDVVEGRTNTPMTCVSCCSEGTILVGRVGIEPTTT